jgi:methyl acetate hydrolase
MDFRNMLIMPPEPENGDMIHRPNRRDILRTTAKLAAAGSIGVDLAAIARAEQPKRPDANSFSKVDAVLRAAARSQELPGVVALAATGKGIVYEGVFGRRRLDAPAAMTRDTVFRVASMVKPITTVAALQLVEQGKLSLDDPVPDIDPALGAPQVLDGFDAAGMPQLRPAKRPITLRHLLTHTSGFTYRLWDAKAVRYFKSIERLSPALRKKAMRSPLMFDPGEQWQYGPGIDWVGRLVVSVSGKSLVDYFREYICGPLGMNDTAFVISPQQRAREAALHRRGPDGSLQPQPQERPVTGNTFAGGAGIYSSAPDYLTFTRMLMAGGALDGVRILRPDTVALMGQNQIGEVNVGVLKTTQPAVSNDVDFFPGIELKWGFGHMMNTQAVPGGRGPASLTWAGLLNTYYWIDPAKRVCAVFMTQVLPFADVPTLRIYRQFEKEIYAAANAG